MRYTDDQLRAIEFVGEDFCVDAGAGAGKTMVLVQRILHLLEKHGIDLDAIVAITFTEKAAAEMKARLRQAAHDRAPTGGPDVMNFWRDVERRMDTARISTIHAFCMALLKQHALSLGRDPDFTPLTEAETHLLRNDVIETALHESLARDDPAATRLAVAYGYRDLVKMLNQLLSRRELAEQALAIQPSDDPQVVRKFWQRAYDEARAEKLEALRTSPDVAEWLYELGELGERCTDASDRMEALRREMSRILRDIVTSHDVDAALTAAMGLDARGGKTGSWVGGKSDVQRIRELKKTVCTFLADYVPPPVNDELDEQAAQHTCDLVAVYRHVFGVYQTAKRRRNAATFDDLIADTVHMLRERDDVRARVARGIRYLLIDEFQDTDSLQYELVRLLLEHPDGPELTIVGDPKQSIYQFRGADVTVFHDARTRQLELVRLNRNFRSVPDTLNFVNHYFGASNTMQAVEERYLHIEAHRDAAGGPRVEFLIPPEEDDALAEDHRIAEAELIAARIAQFCHEASGEIVHDKATGESRPVRYRDVALLFRVFSDVHLYERALRDAGIPYHVVAGRGFFERQEVADLRNLLTLAVDPWNETALLGFLRSPLGGLSDEALLRLTMTGPLAQSFYAGGIPDSFAEIAALNDARMLLENLRRRHTERLPDFLHLVLEETGLEAILLSQYLGEQKAANVRKVCALGETFSRTEAPSLAAFVRYLDDVAREGIREGEAGVFTEDTDAVTLMTIHKAKGLEFPVVFVPDASRGLHFRDDESVRLHRKYGIAVKVVDRTGDWYAPAAYERIRDADRQEQHDEHWRILYVALTRARDWLIVSGAPKVDGKQKDSWMASLDEHLLITSCADGGEIPGDGWSAVVRRTVQTPSVANRQSQDIVLPPADEIERRIAPVVMALTARRHLAVTQLVKMILGDAPEGSHVYESRAGAAALDRGTIIHAYLEQWDFANDAPPNLDTFLQKHCPALKMREKLRQDLSKLARRFSDSETCEQLRNGAPLRREVPFVLPVHDALISGTIDVLLSGNTIIDYKTGRESAENQARYEWQARVYAAAVRALTGSVPPRVVLYYVDHDTRHAVAITPQLLDETLEAAQHALRSNEMVLPAAP